ncbi:MAG TPA: inositol monophosphatase family protein [Acidimicrobiales bacterium]|nr:inositol monophosphatase family protein [Acidimicrobiales bacterium]
MPEPASEPSDHALAARVATEAGTLLLELRAALEAAGTWPEDIGDAGDRQAHNLIVDLLTAARPGDAILSEEGWDDRGRLDVERVWIVDPLDGTREYSERGRSDWAVHVALAVAGVPAAGAVALPARGMTLATDPAPVSTDRWHGPPRLVVSRSRPPHQALRIRDAIDGELVPLGSAGAKAMAVVLGEAEIYAHAGGQYEWDNCAPAAVATAAGLHVSRLDGSPLRYNRPDPWLPDLLICRPELADQILAALH